jgi:hypothetical protein
LLSGTTVLACGPSALSDLNLDRRQIVQLCGVVPRSIRWIAADVDAF